MDAKRAVVWCEPVQAELIMSALQLAGARVEAIGAPKRPDGSALAAAANARPLDDLRAAVVAEQADLLVIAAPDSLDDETRRLVSADARAFVCEPPFGSLMEATHHPEAGRPFEFVPLMRRSPGFRASSEVLPQFGEVSCVNVFFRSGPGQGSLLARLFDAMDLVHSLCGPPESINAALAGPLPSVPERLSALLGHMTANLRFKSNQCACMALSNQAGAWFRGVTVLGEKGQLRISDTGFEWIGLDGAIIDRQNEPASASPSALIGHQIARRFSPATDQGAPMDHVVLMAMCEAARLSCLTGQDEAPSKLMEMMSKP